MKITNSTSVHARHKAQADACAMTVVTADTSVAIA